MSRFFTSMALEVGQSYTLPEEIYHHWVRVLRAQVGDEATLFNGLGGEYQAKLTQIDKKSAQIHILNFNPEQRAAPFAVTIGLVMSKGDRMDYAIQKATELGVRNIQLLTSARCEERLKYERDQKKIIHWQNVAIAACEQCGLNLVPQIFAPLSLETWVAQNDAPIKRVLALQADVDNTPKPKLDQDIALLIGAEGGLSEAEISQAEMHGFVRWQLGSRILRTETAPVVALSVLFFAT